MRIKPGSEDALRKINEEYEGLDVPGYIGMTLYRMDSDPNEIYMSVVFESRETYHANAQSPQQDARYRKMVDLLEDAPEWHDGEVIYQR